MGQPDPKADPTPPAWAGLLARYGPWLLTVIASAVATYFGVKAPAVPPPPVPLTDGLHLDTPINYEGHRYHGDGGPEKVEANGRRWPSDVIPYWIDYPSARSLRPAIPDDAVRSAIRQAANWWCEGLAIDMPEVTDPAAASVRISFDRIDGPLGTLAEAYLADGTSRPKTLTVDSSERWTAGPPASGQVSLATVVCHELGHSLGLGHDDPTAAAVMRPVYTAAIPREQPRDVSRMVALGYRKRDSAPPPPTDVLSFPVQARTADVIDALNKAGYKVSR